jgi:predicted acetyltransferase
VSEAPKIDLELCGPEWRPVLENLFQLYVHDFSDFMAPGRQVDLQEDGRFPPYPPNDAYWREPGHDVLLIRVGGALAGFALINSFAHSGLPIDHSVAEFFVVRKHRRAGVGLAAAAAIVSARPGLWEAAVARRNAAALPFWRKVAATAGAEVEELDRDDDLWNGWILRFRVS